MKQLRFTTKKPMAFLGIMNTESDHAPLVKPEEIGEITNSNEISLQTAYIDGIAEAIAGFDVPVLIDGDMLQLDAPIEEQDILMMLPSGNYKCKSEANDNHYLLRLFSEPSINDVHSKTHKKVVLMDLSDKYKNVIEHAIKYTENKGHLCGCFLTDKMESFITGGSVGYEYIIEHQSFRITNLILADNKIYGDVEFAKHALSPAAEILMYTIGFTSYLVQNINEPIIVFCIKR